MGLSSTHIELVRAVATWVKDNCTIDEYAIMLVDVPESPAANRPFSIGGFYPDVYLKLKRPILGEAKTRYDIETKHSREQYAAYLRHLRLYEDSIFVIAVPWYSVPQARSLIARIQKSEDAMHVKTIFIEKLPG